MFLRAANRAQATLSAAASTVFLSSMDVLFL